MDRSLGKYTVPEALRQAGTVVYVLDDLFPPTTPDEVWLGHAGRQGWIVLTKDYNIRRRRIAIEAILRNRVKMFVLTSRHLRGEEMARAFVRALPRMRRLATNHLPPFIAKVAKSGTVSHLRLRR